VRNFKEMSDEIRRTTLVTILKLGSVRPSLRASALSEQVWFAACYFESISCFVFEICSYVCYFAAEMK
jgi:hypothetical protein